MVASTSRGNRNISIAGVLTASLLFGFCILAASSGAVASEEDQDTASCFATATTATDSDATPKKASSWTDEVGDKFQQFLQDKIFGQDDVFQNPNTKAKATANSNGNQDQQEEASSNESSGGSDGFLSHLFVQEDEKGDDSTDQKEEDKVDAINPFQTLLDRIADIGNDIKESSNKKKHTTPPTSSTTDGVLSSLLDRVRQLNEEDQSSDVVSGTDFLNIMQVALKKALEQLSNTFGDILDNADASIAVALMYFLAYEDSIKNPSWKRRQHRFNEPITKQMVVELHDALYLSQLSYVNTLAEFKDGLSQFQNNEWELAYGTTDSLPHLPAHFLLIHKKLSPFKATTKPTGFFVPPWEAPNNSRKKNDSELTVAIVVRGTKHFSDMIADMMLEPVPYRNGSVHGGMLESGKNLAAKYLPKLKALLEASGRNTIQVTLIGHSLGAAAASIAAMELKEGNEEWMTVEALGFGCPSLLSADLSESTKGYITTIVSDADVVPRLSGASMTNLLLDLMEYDWTENVLEDIEFTLEKGRTSLPSYVSKLLPPPEEAGPLLDWVKTKLEQDFKPKFVSKVGDDADDSDQQKQRPRLSSILIPPGTCYHFFRDGVGYSGVKTPCSFFSTVDLARTLVDDHLIMPGYHRALITIARDWEGDYNFDFKHDIASIPC